MISWNITKYFGEYYRKVSSIVNQLISNLLKLVVYIASLNITERILPAKNSHDFETLDYRADLISKIIFPCTTLNLDREF